jgi:integrase
LPKAQNAIKEARAVAERNGGHLIGGGRDLKAALFRFHRVAADCGLRGEISPHALRYAYACDRVDARLADGFSRREAFVATSLDLGHGDGRGTYIEQVYSRR